MPVVKAALKALKKAARLPRPKAKASSGRPKKATPKPPTKTKTAARKKPGKRSVGSTMSRVQAIHSPSVEGAGLVPSMLPLGRALPFAASARTNWTQGPNASGTGWVALFVASVPGYGTVGMRMDVVISPATVGFEALTPPLLALADDAGGPTSSKPMALWCELVNTTQRVGTGGRVYATQLDQRISLPASPSSMSVTQWVNVLSELFVHPRTKAYSGADFIMPHAWHHHVVDHNAYDTFTEHLGATSSTDLWFQGLAVWPGSASQPRSFNTMVIVIPPFTAAIGSAQVGNSWAFSAYSKWYLRYPVSTVPGQTMKNIPTAKADKVLDLHKQVLETSTAPRPDHPGVGGGRVPFG